LLACALAQAQAALELVVTDGALPKAQQRIVVTQGDALRWRFVSNQAGEVHVHAYRVAATLVPGQPAELAFTARATGRFRVEWHAAGSAPGGHHAPPLAVLEVRPR
jgi:hypothetical protein